MQAAAQALGLDDSRPPPAAVARTGSAAVARDSRRSSIDTEDLGDLERQILAEADAAMRRQSEAAAAGLAKRRSGRGGAASTSGVTSSGGDATNDGGEDTEEASTSVVDSVDLELLLAEAEAGIAAAAIAMDAGKTAATANATANTAARLADATADPAARLAPGGMRTSGGTLDPVFESSCGSSRRPASRAHGNAAAALKAVAARRERSAAANKRQQQSGRRLGSAAARGAGLELAGLSPIVMVGREATPGRGATGLPSRRQGLYKPVLLPGNADSKPAVAAAPSTLLDFSSDADGGSVANSAGYTSDSDSGATGDTVSALDSGGSSGGSSNGGSLALGEGALQRGAMEERVSRLRRSSSGE
jgi:hypothetical protein